MDHAARRQQEPGYLAKFSLALVFAAFGFLVMILAARKYCIMAV